MNLLVSEILDQVDGLKTKQEKIDLLKRYENPAIRLVLRINFDPNLNMGLPEGEPPYKKELDKPIGYHETNLIKELRRFYIWLDPKTQLPKVRKEKLFIEMLEGLHHTEAEVLCLAKDRKLQKKYKSVKADIVRESYPGLLPPEPPKSEKSLNSVASGTD